MFESLESRQLMSATAGPRALVPADGVLTIDGTDMADQIQIFRTSDDYLIIDHLAGRIDPKTGEFIPSTAIDRRPVPVKEVRLIVVKGGLGDDLIDVSAAGIGAVLDGGRGDDVLIGSAKSDLLLGGDGNDRLFGLDGIDVLSGGRGKDYLDGGLDSSPDVYDGGAGRDTAVVRAPALAITDVEKILDGRG
jgi:Ca2+-binding RTX toxin-like protein